MRTRPCALRRRSEDGRGESGRACGPGPGLRLQIETHLPLSPAHGGAWLRQPQGTSAAPRPCPSQLWVLHGHSPSSLTPRPWPGPTFSTPEAQHTPAQRLPWPHGQGAPQPSRAASLGPPGPHPPLAALSLEPWGELLSLPQLLGSLSVARQLTGHPGPREHVAAVHGQASSPQRGRGEPRSEVPVRRGARLNGDVWLTPVPTLRLRGPGVRSPEQRTLGRLTLSPGHPGSSGKDSTHVPMPTPGPGLGADVGTGGEGVSVQPCGSPCPAARGPPVPGLPWGHHPGPAWRALP